MPDSGLRAKRPDESLLSGQRQLRAKLLVEAEREQTYPMCLTSRECLTLLAVVEAAERFVATTSYYRQPKASRHEFEDMAVALMIARGDV